MDCGGVSTVKALATSSPCPAAAGRMTAMPAKPRANPPARLKNKSDRKNRKNCRICYPINIVSHAATILRLAAVIAPEQDKLLNNICDING
jgi:hypothetical protein